MLFSCIILAIWSILIVVFWIYHGIVKMNRKPIFAIFSAFLQRCLSCFETRKTKPPAIARNRFFFYRQKFILLNIIPSYECRYKIFIKISTACANFIQFNRKLWIRLRCTITLKLSIVFSDRELTVFKLPAQFVFFIKFSLKASNRYPLNSKQRAR